MHYQHYIVGQKEEWKKKAKHQKDIRCFTKTDDWDEWLAVKERLAIEIKQIVEKNKASFAFPSSLFMLRKNDCYLLFSTSNIKNLFLCSYCQCNNKLANSI